MTRVSNLAGWPVLALGLIWLAGHGNIFFPDEGFYLYAAKAVWQGQTLYRDRLYFQAPLLPILLAPVAGLFPGSLYAARLLCAAACLACAAIVAGLVPGPARRWVPWLLLASPYAAQTLTLPVAYGSISSGFVLGSVLLAVRTSSGAGALGAGALAGAAAACRLPFLPLLAVPAVALWRRGRPGLIPACMAGVAAVLAAVFLPFMLAAPEEFWFNNWTVQSLRQTQIPLWWGITGTGLAKIAVKVIVAMILWDVPLLWLAWRGWCHCERSAANEALALLFAIHLVVHLLPAPTWTLYFCMSVLILLVPASQGMEAFWRDAAGSGLAGLWRASFLALLAWWALFQGTTIPPKPRDGNFFGRTRFFSTHLAALDHLRRCPIDSSGPVFTFMLPAAYALNSELPRGAEMSLFGYFPRWDAVEARGHGLLGTAALVNMLEQQVPSLVIKDQYWDLVFKEIPRERRIAEAALNQNYERIPCPAGVPGLEFGLYRRRTEPLRIFPRTDE